LYRASFDAYYVKYGTRLLYRHGVSNRCGLTHLNALAKKCHQDRSKRLERLMADNETIFMLQNVPQGGTP